MKTTLAKVLLLISSNYHINYNNLSSFQKDLELERKVMQWIVNIIKEKPESPSQYDRWIQDGSVLAKLMINIVFNSVPIEVVHSNWGSVSVFDDIAIDLLLNISAESCSEPSQERASRDAALWRD